MTGLAIVTCVGASIVGPGVLILLAEKFGFLRLFGVFGFLGFLGVCGFFGGLRDVIGGVIVGVVFLLLVVACIIIEVGERRVAQVPAYLRAVTPQAPRTLRWVHNLLPGEEGAAWLVEVTSCLAETLNKGERRRYLRSYRRSVPRLIWSSWTVRLSASRRRELL